MIEWTKRALIAVTAFWAGGYTAAVWFVSDIFHMGIRDWSVRDIVQTAIIAVGPFLVACALAAIRWVRQV